MAVYAGVLEVDSSFTFSVHNDLQLRFAHGLSDLPERMQKESTHLVVPSICTCSHLYTLLQVVRATQEVSAEFRQVFSLAVIQTNDEQGRVHNSETFRVVLVRLENAVSEI